MSVRAVRHDERLRARIVSVKALMAPRTGARVWAASAVLKVAGRLFCVEYDALSAAWVDPPTLSVERVMLLGGGGRLARAEKADFEAAFVGPRGEIFVLGLGGTAKQKRVVRYKPDMGYTVVIEARALYDAIGARLPVPPNTEGAVLLGSTVRLFHRANGRRGGTNASFDVRLAVLEAGAGVLEGEVLYDLGAIADAADAGASQSPLPSAPRRERQVIEEPVTDATPGCCAADPFRRFSARVPRPAAVLRPIRRPIPLCCSSQVVRAVPSEVGGCHYPLPWSRAMPWLQCQSPHCGRHGAFEVAAAYCFRASAVRARPIHPAVSSAGYRPAQNRQRDTQNPPGLPFTVVGFSRPRHCKLWAPAERARCSAVSTSPHPATRSVAYAIDAGAKASSKGTSSRGADPSELVTPVTITLPPIALPAVTVQAAPPALITRRNAGHVGMSGSELLRVLREMRADSHFRDAVIVRGKSFRAASPDSIIAFLRASAASSGAANDEEGTDHGVDLSLLHAAGYELGPAPSKGQHVEGFARRAAPVQSDNMPRRRAASRPR